jgi:hypothetical protein
MSRSARAGAPDEQVIAAQFRIPLQEQARPLGHVGLRSVVRIADIDPARAYVLRAGDDPYPPSETMAGISVRGAAEDFRHAPEQ